jgi:hypothetical protein
MAILIPFAIIHILHQLRWCITDRKGHRQISKVPHRCLGGADSYRRRIAFRRRGQVGRKLGKYQVRFGLTYFVHGIETGIGQQQGIGIGITDVLAR